MIDMKDQCFGVEVEFTGITREQAANALAEYFGTTPRRPPTPWQNTLEPRRATTVTFMTAGM